MDTIFTKNRTDENPIHGLEKPHPLMSSMDEEISSTDGEMSFMDGEMSLMDESVIRGCHLLMSSVDVIHG